MQTIARATRVLDSMEMRCGVRFMRKPFLVDSVQIHCSCGWRRTHFT
jgi:hypothetical protein